MSARNAVIPCRPNPREKAMLRSLTEKFTNALKSAFEPQYGPLYPRPAVKERLERMGYKFEYDVYNAGRSAVPVYKIHTPKGQTIAIHRSATTAGDKAKALYLRAYDRARTLCAKAPEPSF